MSFAYLEVFLWTALIIAIWKIRVSLPDPELEELPPPNSETSDTSALVNPLRSSDRIHYGEVIGSYHGTPIYRSLEWRGESYMFERVKPVEDNRHLPNDEILVGEHLVYRRARLNAG